MQRAMPCGVLAAACALTLVACSGLSQLQDTIGKFDEGAHAVALGQMGFLRQVQAADCANQFYGAAFQFSVKATDQLDLRGLCTPSILSDEQLRVRQALMDALTLYVDKVQTLASGDSNTSLDTNSLALATRLNKLASQHGLSGSLTVAQGVEAAVTGVAEMVLDQRRFGNIKQAAQAMSPHIKNLVEALKNENTVFAQGLSSKIAAIEPQLHAAVLDARARSGARSFLDVIAARDLVRKLNPLGEAPVAQSAGAADPSLDPQNVTQSLNAALDALVNANDAIANAGTGGLMAAVHDLGARAQHVNDLLKTLRD